MRGRGSRLPGGRWRARCSDLAPALLALCIFLGATGYVFRGLWGLDPRRFVVVNQVPTETEDRDRWQQLLVGDLRFVAGLTARNARTLVTQPWSLYDLEQCHPTPRALALGEPLIAAGLVGVPAYLLLRDPVLIFNFVLLILPALSSAGMFLLVRRWTGSSAAGVAAGLAYGFHAIKMHDLVHFFVWDGTGTVFALFFADRLLERGQVRDALGFAAATAFQMAGSIYPLLAAAALSLPVAAALVRERGVGRLGVRSLLAACVPPLVVAAAVFTPYLAQRATGALETRRFQAFFAWSWLAWNEFSPGFSLPALALLALLGLALRYRRGGLAPRVWVPVGVAAGGGLCLLLATGGTLGQVQYDIAHGRDPVPETINLWAWLAHVVPGLETLRAPAALYSGVHLALALLAGFGVAAAQRLVPGRGRVALGLVLAGAVAIEVIRPVELGLQPRLRYEPFELAPQEAVLGFFAELRQSGDDGPLLEVGIPPRDDPRAALGFLLTNYHGRRTSLCYNSFRGPLTREVGELIDRLPDSAAWARLQQLGFTTVVFHHAGPYGALQKQRMRRIVSASPFLRALVERPFASAFSLGPPPVRTP